MMSHRGFRCDSEYVCYSQACLFIRDRDESQKSRKDSNGVFYFPLHVGMELIVVLRVRHLLPLRRVKGKVSQELRMSRWRQGP